MEKPVENFEKEGNRKGRRIVTKRQDQIITS